MTAEEQAQERSDAQFALECIAFGFVLGVAYCVANDLLRLRNEVRIIRRINRFRHLWHESRLDEEPTTRPAPTEEKADDAS